MRVRLTGLKGNPDGIGALVRLGFGERLGPAREIRAGSGYWSQDSATAVLATPEAPSKVWVRWPGGKVVTAGIPKGAKAISVDPDGKVRAME